MSKQKVTLVNLVFFLVAYVLHKTYRYRFFKLENRRAAEQKHDRGVVALGLWHQNSFVGTLSHHHQAFSPLCSLSKDGRMVAFLCERIGLTPILGSSSRGGKNARDALLEGVSAGLSPAITVDGPKGPPRAAKPGIIDIARKARVMVVPMTAVADRAWQLGSWDKLRVPKPFARVAVCYGEAITVPADAADETFEACRALLDRRLNALDDEARQSFAAWSTGISRPSLPASPQPS